MAVKIESIDVSKVSAELSGYYMELINLNIPEKEAEVDNLRNELAVTIDELNEVEEQEKVYMQEQSAVKVKYDKHKKSSYEVERKKFPKTEYSRSLRRVLSVFAPVIALALVFIFVMLTLFLLVI